MVHDDTVGASTPTLPTAPVLDLRHAIGLGVVFLVFITPFGGESTAGWAMFLHRLLLFGIVGLCVVGLRQVESRDFGMAVYGLVGASLLIMFSAIWTGDRAPFDGFYLWYHHLLFAAFFLLLARFANRQPLRWKSAMLGGVTTVVVLHCVWSLATQTPPLAGPFINTNYFGSYLLVGFAAALATTARHPALAWRILASVSTVILLYGITQTLSRGALIAAIGVMILALYRMRRRVKLAALGVLIVILAGFSPQIVNKFTDLGTSDPYNYMRLQVWGSTLSMIGENPLLGVGLEGYQDVASRFPAATDGTVGRFARRHKMAHSEYLHYAAEIGIPATLIFVILLAYFFVALARARSRAPADEAFLTEAGFLAAGGIGAHALVDNNFTVPVVAAALAVVALARVPMPRYSRLPQPTSLEWRTALGLLLAVFFLHSTVVPALATHFNEAGQREFRASRFEAAERAHRRAVALAPDHPLLLTNLGTMYLDRFSRTRDAHWLDTADAFFSRAVEFNPNHIVARRQRHLVLTLKLRSQDPPSKDSIERLIQNSREILQVDPISVFVRRNLAEALYASGRGEEAVQELHQAIKIEPHFVQAYRRLAEWYLEDGDPNRSDFMNREADRILASFGDTENMNGYEVDLLNLREQARAAELEQAIP